MTTTTSCGRFDTDVMTRMVSMRDIVSLTKNREFQRVYKKGKSFVSPLLITYVMKNNKGKVRVGITTSKKTGKAVQRNRARRIIREAYRKLSESVKSGYDIVFVSRARTHRAKMNDVLAVMSEHLHLC